MMVLSAFADEIADNFEEQVKFLVDHGIRWLDLRSAWGTNVMQLSEEQLLQIEEILSRYGCRVACIGTPIGKVPLERDVQEDVADVQHAVTLAQRFRCDAIRIFSFYQAEDKTKDDGVDQAADKLREMTKSVEGTGLTLLLENEKPVIGDTADRCRQLLDAVDSPDLLLAFDPANFVQCGEDPVDYCWPRLKDQVAWIHLKDAHKSDSTISLYGEGDGQIPELMTTLKSHGFSGFMTMEPHLSKAEALGGFTGPDDFETAITTISGMMESAGIRSTLYNIALVGGGNIATIYATAIRKIPSAHLKLVIDKGTERAQQFAEDEGAEYSTDIDASMQRDDIDIVVVCTPSGSHADLALKAAAAGKHCIVEKPIDVTHEKGKAIIDAFAEKNLQVTAICQNRFLPGRQELKEAIADGQMGTLTYGSAYTKWYRTDEYFNSSDWRGTWAMDGGGALMNQSVHQVDLLIWYMGPVETVAAHMATLDHDIEAEDVLSASLRFRNGAIGTIEASTALYPGFPARLEIFGTRGGVAFEPGGAIGKFPRAGVTLLDDIEEESDDPNVKSHGAADPLDVKDEGHMLQISDFLESIEDNRKPLITAEEALYAVDVICAIYESARTGKVVEVPPPLNS
jgi:UDP-N-acetyl-2-amino-2-deoxyglucuronate dehydrogenase